MYVASKQRLFINLQQEMHTTVTVRSNQMQDIMDYVGTKKKITVQLLPTMQQYKFFPSSDQVSNKLIT